MASITNELTIMAAYITMAIARVCCLRREISHTISLIHTMFRAMSKAMYDSTAP